MLRSRTMIHFAILIGLGLAGVIVARNYGGFQAFLKTINLKSTFESECLAADCSDSVQADASEFMDPEDYPEPTKTPSTAPKATVDVKVKKQ